MNISKKRSFLTTLGVLLLLTTLSAQIPERGGLVSSTLLRHYSKAQISAEYASQGLPEFVSPIEYEIDAYKIVYWTLNPQGTGLTYASGVVMLPLAYPCGAPIMIYNHGTIIHDADVPSNQGGEFFVGIPFTANGYIVAMPDYLGLGESSGRHPYIHAASEASCGVDMLRATRNLCDSLAAELNGQIFITGYSQGGHVAMAQFKALETEYAGEFTVTAAAPASGPYDVSGVTRDFLLSNTPSYTNSWYMSYVILGFQEVYGNLYNDLSEVFVPPYDTQVPLLFDRSGSQGSVNLPLIATEMLQDSVLQAITNDSLHPFNVALRDNDLYDWSPQAPLRMYYCEADEQVPYQNALVAKAAMIANNAANVDALSAGVNFDHGGCALPSFLQGKFFFDTRRELCSTAIAAELALGLQVSPNPFHQSLRVQWDDLSADIQEVRLLNLAGQVALRQSVTRPGEITLQNPALPAGVYILELIGQRNYYRRVVVQ